MIHIRKLNFGAIGTSLKLELDTKTQDGN